MPTIYAGESGTRNPFYLGLYGGAESAGFLESDSNAAPFLASLGYQPAERFILMCRDISEKKDPFDPRLLMVKRTMKFGVQDHPPDATWWWLTRHGRFGSLTFNLIPNSGGAPPAEVTFWEMELHAATRGERTAGITGLSVTAGERRKGLAKALLTEVIRRLRDEVVTRVEVTIREDNTAALNLFRALNFEQFDTGIVYRKQVPTRQCFNCRQADSHFPIEFNGPQRSSSSRLISDLAALRRMPTDGEAVPRISCQASPTPKLSISSVGPPASN